MRYVILAASRLKSGKLAGHEHKLDYQNAVAPPESGEHFLPLEW